MNDDLELMNLINEIDSDDDTVSTTSYYSSDSDYTIEEDYEERERERFERWRDDQKAGKQPKHVTPRGNDEDFSEVDRYQQQMESEEMDDDAEPGGMTERDPRSARKGRDVYQNKVR